MAQWGVSCLRRQCQLTLYAGVSHGYPMEFCYPSTKIFKDYWAEFGLNLDKS